jgi:threonine synthase
MGNQKGQLASSWLPNSGLTGSTLTHLEGGLSKERYDADSLINTDPVDGKPLLARYDLAKAKSTLTADAMRSRRLGGLWRWHEILPVKAWESVFTLGEGSTPLLEARRLGEHFGLASLYLKCESLNPTGSFKARGMAVAVSRAAELGAKRLVAPSAGNAAGALSAYAAVAGIPAIVIMPTDAPSANQVEVLATGADLILMDGLITDCGRLARLISAELGAFDLSTLKEPYRVEGKKSLGLELAEDLNWELPDVVIYPTGGGTGLVGMWKAFDELETLGLIGSARPRMFSVQAEGCAPIVRAFEAGTKFAEPWENAHTQAGGLRVPSAVGDFLILDCLRASKGGAVAVPEAELNQTQRLVGALGGGYLSLETAAAIAALPELLADSRISRDDRIVVFDTGAGFKSEGAVPDARRPVSSDSSQWGAIVERLRAG